MVGKLLLIFSAAATTAAARATEPTGDPMAGDTRARSDVNTHADESGYLPGRRSFYSYPRHRHIDGRGDAGLISSRRLEDSYGGSPNSDANHGSPYYGINYGAPYHGGAYYKGGVYYRERRD